MQFNTPEPYRQDEASAHASDNSIEETDADLSSGPSIKSTLWQTLNDRTTSRKPPVTLTPKIKLATDRMDYNDYTDTNSGKKNLRLA